MTPERVLKAYAMLRATWPARMEIYQDQSMKAVLMKQLELVNPDLLLKSVESLCATRTTLFPGDNLVALLNEQAADAILAEHDGPEAICVWIKSTLRTGGRDYDGGWPTEEIRAAVEMLGGWWNLCMSSAEKNDINMNRVRKELAARREQTKQKLMRSPEYSREMLAACTEDERLRITDGS